MRNKSNKQQIQPPQKSSDLFEMIWEVVRLIPAGRVTNYGSIAKYIGSGLSSRVVGYAMNASHHSSKKVPAHRVVNRIGVLSGKHHFKTPFEMQELLEKEGTEVKDDKVLDFQKKFWDPNIELAL